MTTVIKTDELGNSSTLSITDVKRELDKESRNLNSHMRSFNGTGHKKEYEYDLYNSLLVSGELMINTSYPKYSYQIQQR